MAHGFLTPTPVSGESPISKYFEKKVNQLIDKGVKKLEDVAAKKFNQFKDALFAKKRDTTYRSGRGRVEVAGRYGIGENTAKGGGILGGSSVKGILPQKAGIVNTEGKTAIVGRNATDIDRKEQKYLGTTDPDVAGGPKTRKGGTFTDFGSTAQAKPLNDTNFFSKAVNEGVDANTGEYLSKEARIAAFQKGKVARNPDQGAPPISPDSGADIVAAVNRNTEAIMAMVDVTKAQTSNDTSLVKEQIQAQETMMSRSAARAEEKALEQGSDLSGFMTPENFAKKKQQEAKKETGSKLKEIIRGPNPFKQECCMGGGGGIEMPLGRGRRSPRARPRGGGLPIPDFVEPKARMPGGLLRRGAGRALTRGAARIGGKAAAKGVAKGLGKMGLKKIPGVGAIAGAAFAAERAMKGDWLGAGGELLSGIAGTIPGVGTAISAGIDAGLMARDAGMTPFATGGIVTQPTQGLVGEAGQEGVFPLEGSRGKKTFQMFGEGIMEAQKRAKDEFSKIQAAGLKFYFQNQDGFKFFGDILKTVFAPFLGPLKALGGLKDLGGGLLNSLLGGNANAATLGMANVGGATGEQNLAAFLSTMEASGNQNQADAFQVMLNRAADAQAGGSMKAYGTSLGDQITAREQFSPISSAIYGVSADSAAAAKYGPISKALGNSPAERKKKLLEIASQPDGLAALQKLFGGGSASDAAKVLQDFKSGGALSQQSASDIGSMVSFRGYRSGSDDFNRGKGGNFFFGKGSKGKVGTLADVSPAASPGSGSLASAAESLRGMSTRDGPGGGSVSCVYAVNKVFNKAGMTPPWGGAQDTLSAIRGMKAAGWQQVGFGEAQPGDVWVYDDGATKGHVGIKTSDGKVLSNSSSKASFTWAADQGELLSWYPTAGITPPGGTFFRPPSTDSVTQPANPIASAPLSAEQKSQMFQNAGMPALSANALTNATPGPVPASPVSPNTGTPIMATSAQVASASHTPTTAPTIINNYYGDGGSQPMGVNPNGVTAGIGMDGTGTSVFQDLRIRSLG